MELSKVSVVIPVRNEERCVTSCLASICQQTYPIDNYEVIVVDGLSSDRSNEIIRRFVRNHSNIVCLSNPAAIAPAAMNIGIRTAQGDIIIRADAHNVYRTDYIENCVRYLNETGADNVGGPLTTVPADNSFGARLVAAVLTSPFGVGNSRFRIGSTEGYVETVPFGAFRRELFDRVGMYNEKLVRNQDNELNARIRRAGGKIFQTPALTTEYHPVASFLELLKQTFRTSQWHVFTMTENARAMSPRHLAPALFVIGLASLCLLSFFSPRAPLFLITILTIYLAAGLALAIGTRERHGVALSLTLPFACFCYHMSYGAGTLAGLKYLAKSPSRQPIRAGQPVAPADSP